eukprot:3653683-Pyramimonas_sp.AAC.1
MSWLQADLVYKHAPHLLRRARAQLDAANTDVLGLQECGLHIRSEQSPLPQRCPQHDRVSAQPAQ